MKLLKNILLAAALLLNNSFMLARTGGTIAQKPILPTKITPAVKQPVLKQSPQPKPKVPTKIPTKPQAKPVQPQKKITPSKQVKPTTVKPQPKIQPQPKAPQKQPQPVKKPVVTPLRPKTEAIPPAENRFITNNLVMTLDPRGKETVAAGSGLMVQQALIALYEKASPIIMTNNVFEIIVTIRAQIGDQELNTLRTLKTQYQKMISYAEQLRTKVRIANVNYIKIMALALIDFDANNLNCYFHTAENLVLLIPKQYIKSNMSSALNLNANEQAKVCGFNPAVLNPITDMNPQNLLRQIQIQKSKPVSEEKFIPHLTSMFTIQKRNGQLIHPEQTSRWLIYLTGHGGPAHMTIGTVRKQLAQFRNATTVIVTENGVQRKVSPKEMVKKFESMLAGRSAWKDSQLIPESAQIAGISASQFAQLMKFFDDSIDTAYLHYVTCFSGGYNQTFVNETLSSLDVNFIVSTRGIHEGYVSESMGNKYENQSIQITGTDFAEFFKLLRLFFTQQKTFVKMKPTAEDPILMILKTISFDLTPQNQPFVRFPSTESFVAVPLAESREKLIKGTWVKETLVRETLTKTIVKAHEIERKPITIKPDVNVLVINTPRIDVTLNLGKKRDGGHTAIVIPAPESFLPGYEALEVFKEINWQDTVQSLLYNLSYLNNRMYSQTFAIKTLSGILLQQSGLPAPKQSANIHNFIMHIRGVPGEGFNTGGPSMQFAHLSAADVQRGKTGSNIQIAFEYNSNLYQCMFAIRDIENPKDLLTNIQKLAFKSTPLQSANMNTIASIFLTPQEINKVRKPITLESLIDFIDDKIDKQDPSMAIWSEANTQALRKFAREHTK